MTQRRIYQSDFPYFVTFNTKDGLPIFEETKYAKLLFTIIFNAGKLKIFDILSYQIMPDHVHLLTYQTNRTTTGSDRTLENVRSVLGNNNYSSSESTLSRVRTNSRVRTGSESRSVYTISDLLQSIKGNFSREIHRGNIWQKRFYTRIINNRKYLSTIIEYIRQNPIKAELSSKYHKKPYQYFNFSLIGKL